MADLWPLPGWCRIDPDLAVAKVQVCGAADAPERLAAALNVPPPAANRYSANSDIALAAIAPGEWLVTGPANGVARALERAEAALDGDTLLALDVTDGVVALRLEGAAGTACLAAFTPLDLRPQGLPSGAAVRTRFGDVGLFVARTGDAPTYLLLAEQSYAPYILRLIGQAARST